jgi:hypothetical protein
MNLSDEPIPTKSYPDPSTAEVVFEWLFSSKADPMRSASVGPGGARTATRPDGGGIRPLEERFARVDDLSAWRFVAEALASEGDTWLPARGEL